MTYFVIIPAQCGFAEYDCNSVCLPFTTMCDGIVDCVGGELQDEDPFLCAGKEVIVGRQSFNTTAVSY